MRKSIIGAVLVMGAIIFLLGLKSQDIEFKVTVSPEEVKAGQVFKYQIAADVETDKLPEIELPEFKTFNVISRRTSKNISYKGKKAVVSVSLIYALVALEEGDLELPAAVIKSGPKKFPSPSARVKVSGKVLEFEKEKKIPHEALKGAVEI
jgi:hypothetical protein